MTDKVCCLYRLLQKKILVYFEALQLFQIFGAATLQKLV